MKHLLPLLLLIALSGCTATAINSNGKEIKIIGNCPATASFENGDSIETKGWLELPTIEYEAD